MDNVSKKISKLINLIFKALVFLVPLFFLPWTTTLSGMDNFNKLNLLLFFAPLLFFAFFFIRIRRGDFRFKQTMMDWPVLLFLVAAALATIFSLDKMASVFGAFSYISSPFSALLSLVLFYYFTLHFFKKEKEISDFIKIFFKIYAVIVLAAGIFVLGYWIGILENEVVSKWFRLAVGALDDLAVFLAVIDVLILGLLSEKNYLRENFKKDWEVKVIKISLVLSFVIIALINCSAAWLGLFLGTAVIVFLNYFYFFEKKDWKKRALNLWRDPKMVWFNAVLFFSLLILLLNVLSYSAGTVERRQAQKMQLGYGHSYGLTKNVLKTRPLFGYGPENYGYAFSSLRPAGLNNSDYWYLRFNHGSSYLFDALISVGIFGFLGLIGIFGVFGYVAFAVLKRIKKEEDKNYFMIALIAALFALIIAQIFSAVNLVLLFIFWLFLAFFMVCAEENLSGLKSKKIFKEIKIEGDQAQRIILIIFVSAVFLWLLLLGLGFKFWLADASFKKALNQPVPEKKEIFFQKAAQSNPWRYNYKIALAKYYRDKSLDALNRPNKDLEAIKNDVNQSIDWARSAVKAAPFAVAAHETLGSVYRDLGPYLQGEEILVVETFQQAINLEPTNPVLYAELGKVYLVNGLLEEAKKFFQISLDLRRDNYEASLGMAKTLAALGNSSQSLEMLKILEEVHPTVDGYYEQGRIYYNLGNYNHAIVKFQQVISLSPLHANALYSLGLSLEANKEYDAALHYFNKVNQLNPGNKQTEDKIKQIKAKSEE